MMRLPSNPKPNQAPALFHPQIYKVQERLTLACGLRPCRRGRRGGCTEATGAGGCHRASEGSGGGVGARGRRRGRGLSKGLGCREKEGGRAGGLPKPAGKLAALEWQAWRQGHRLADRRGGARPCLTQRAGGDGGGISGGGGAGLEQLAVSGACTGPRRMWLWATALGVGGLGGLLLPPALPERLPRLWQCRQSAHEGAGRCRAASCSPALPGACQGACQGCGNAGRPHRGRKTLPPGAARKLRLHAFWLGLAELRDPERGRREGWKGGERGEALVFVRARAVSCRHGGAVHQQPVLGPSYTQPISMTARGSGLFLKVCTPSKPQ